MVDVAIENSSPNTKREIRNLCLGNTITVGVTGDYPSIELALDYIATQPTMTVVANTAIVNFTQYSHWVPRVSGDMADARPGDFIFLDNDDPGNQQLSYHYYRILSADDNPESEPGLMLEHCIVGPTQNGLAAAIFRPAKFIIQLLPDAIYTTTGATMPDGYEITIIGCGRNTIVTGAGIAMPIYGYTRFENFINDNHLTTFDTRTVDAGIPLFDGGFSAVEMRNIWAEGEEAFVLGNMSFQSIRCKGLYCNGFKGHRIYNMMIADYINIDDMHYNGVSAMEIAEIYKVSRRCDSSHRKIIRNSSFRRSQDHSGVANLDKASMFRFNVQPELVGMPDYTLDFIQCQFDDDGLNIADQNHGVFGFLDNDIPSTESRIRFIDCEVNNENSHTADMVVESGYTINNRLHIEFIRTMNRNGNQITDAFPGTATAIIKYEHPRSSINMNFSGGLVPNADQAENIYIDVMTSAVTMLNPTFPRKNQLLRLHFEQDATGNWAISWAAATNMKVHTNPTGGPNQKAIFEFIYDGTHWVQQNATAWV